MKNSYVYLVLLSFCFQLNYSQQQGFNNKYVVLDPNTAGKIFRNPLNVADKPLGSPYLISNFFPAKVSTVDQKAMMRYNVYNDEFEFMTPKRDTLILDKIEGFSDITFTENNKHYKLLNYLALKNKLTYGYLIQLYEKNNLALYKKENIKYYDGKIAKTSLERNMPAKYVKVDDTYFYKDKDEKTIAFPESKKELLKLYTDKKETIETFFKENKIGFKEENDLKRILDLIAGF